MTEEEALVRLRDLLDARRFDDAMDFISTLANQQVTDKGVIHCMRGSVYDRQGEVRLAEREYRKVLGFKGSGLYAEGLSRNIYALKRMGRKREALQRAQQLVRQYPRLPDGHRILGELLHDCARHAEAVPFLESAHESDPTNRRVSWALVRSLYLAGFLAEGRTKLNQMLGSDEDDWDNLVVLADQLYVSDQYKPAEELYLRHLKERPADTDILPNLMYAAQELNDLDTVETAAKELAVRRDRPVAAILALAEVAFAREHYDEARELLQELLLLASPNNGVVQALAARMAFQEERYSDAYHIATKVLKINDHSDFMRSIAGAAACHLELDREAVELLRAYLERNEPDTWVMRDLASAEFNLGNFHEACSAIEYCLKDEYADDVEMHRAYASTLHQLGRLKEARREYDLCLSHDADDLEMLFGLMFLLEETGDLDGSKQIAVRLVRDGYRTDSPEFQMLAAQNDWSF